MDNKVKATLKKTDKNVLVLFGLAVLIFIIMGALEPKSFLGATNINGMLSQFPELGLISLGMMLAMISGGIDLSLVGIANFAGIVAAAIMVGMGGSGASIAVGIMAALLVGTLCGLFNGFMIGYLRVPPMLVTLCGLQLYTGMGLIITKGPAITGLPEAFGFLGLESIGGIPVSAVIFLLAALGVAFLLKSTVYGQHLCFMGTNATAARYSGIHNLKVTMATYGISGFLGGLAGLIIASHYSSAKSDYGSSYTLLSLLIVVLGGTNPDGGRGKTLGVALSVIVLQLISSAFNIMRVNAFLKTFVWGLVLILVMAAMKILENRKAAR